MVGITPGETVVIDENNNRVTARASPHFECVPR
jgi:hypothetical protein